MPTSSSKKTKKVKPIKTFETSLKVFNLKGKEVDKYGLDKQVFDGKVSPQLMHQAVVTYLANQRQGSASTKKRGEVRGGGTKPWRQKGTGRARVGSIRSPLWRGGGVTFGPKPRSFRQDLPKKMKALALKSALNQKNLVGAILILEGLKVDSAKTKNMAGVLKGLKLSQEKVRFVVERVDSNLKLATRNLKKASLIKASDVNALEVINCKRLVATKQALKEIEIRVKKCLQ